MLNKKKWEFIKRKFNSGKLNLPKYLDMFILEKTLVIRENNLKLVHIFETHATT